MKTFLVFCIAALIYVQNGRASVENNEIVSKDSTFKDRLFSLKLFPFLVVHVKPNPCVGSTTARNGTCYTDKDCNSKGGMADGSCASGYGVCCLMELRCGAVIKENNSLLVNEEYPKDTTQVGNCQYIIQKVNDNICQLRLDFEHMNIEGPDERSSLCEEDSFTVVGTAGENPRVICGVNTGQHMYVDLASGSGSARINIATTSQGKPRSWKIQVSQIACDSIHRAPRNCLQYFTEYTGVINSFNYLTTNKLHHIGGQSYAVCIKTGEGFCGITYQSDDFSVSGNATEDEAISVTGDDSCNIDFVSVFVQDKTGKVGDDRFCGTGFNDTTTFSKPFELRVITDTTEEEDEVNNKGFSIKYMQIPC